MAYNGRCEYEEINRNVDGEEINLRSEESSALKTNCLLRQILICSAMWSSYFATGLCLGAPTVVVPQLRREANSTDAVSQEMASWLSSAIAYSAAVVVVLLAILSRFFGRKVIFLLSLLAALVGFLILYFSKTVIQLIIGFVFVGFLLGNQITICLMIITEYTSPRYRGVFLMMKSASFVWGIWIANIIGTFFHYKHIFTLGFFLTIYAIVTIYKWPDSPYWLAGKGRFVECTTAHRWLKGHSAESNRELEVLLEREKNRKQERVKENYGNTFNKYCRVISSRTFFKPLLLSMLIMSLYNSTGKMACAVYAIDIIKKITGSETTAYYGMLILDGVTVVGMYVGCWVSKVVRRRPLLFTTTALGVLFLYLLSLHLYLVQRGLLRENTFVSMLLLAPYILAVSVGPMIMGTSLVSELYPLSFRNLFAVLIGLYSHFIFACSLKIVPMLFSVCGAPGAFFFYATMASFCVILLYRHLPETKDKTQGQNNEGQTEIENLMTNNQL